MAREAAAEIGDLFKDDDFRMSPGEVAKLFDVDPKTVTRWARAGKLRCIRTLGGHRRYSVTDVVRLRGLDTSELPV